MYFYSVKKFNRFFSFVLGFVFLTNQSLVAFASIVDLDVASVEEVNHDSNEFNEIILDNNTTEIEANNSDTEGELMDELNLDAVKDFEVQQVDEFNDLDTANEYQEIDSNENDFDESLNQEDSDSVDTKTNVTSEDSQTYKQNDEVIANNLSSDNDSTPSDSSEEDDALIIVNKKIVDIEIENDLEIESVITKENDIFKSELPIELKDPILIYSNNRISGSGITMRILNVATTSQRVIEGDKVRYKNVFDKTDLLYEFTDKGIKESILLEGSGHPDFFEYELNMDDYDFVQISKNQIDLYKKGKSNNPLFKIFSITAPLMFDSTGAVSEEIFFEINGNTLRLIPDTDWLSNSVYPVVVDPTFEISVLNVHSHPIAGQEWKVSFVTNGVSDLYIKPADQETIDDMDFKSIFCGEEDMTALVQVLVDDAIFYPSWSCDDVAIISHEINTTGKHHLIFEFGGEVVNAYNSAVSWDGGAGTSNWNDALNWSNDLVPGVDDDVVIASNIFVNINSATTINSLTIGNVGGTDTSVLNFNYDAYENGALSINNSLIIYTNASITHSTSTNTILGRINLEVGGDATILGSINANSRGYHATAGTGSPPSISGTTGTGASHGGFGSLGVGTPETLGNIYGSTTAPTDLGSGGGRAINGAGAASTGLWGGGAIIMNVVGTTTISGTISANGSNSEPVDLSWNPGSGSGGSVYIRTGGISGSGTISANGGGANPYVGGGGGRIAVYYENDSSTVNMTANGGGYRVPNSIKRFAGAGTVYKKSSEQNYGQLIIGNNNLGTNVEYLVGLTPVPVEITNLDSFTISNSASVYLSGSLNTTDFNILSNGIFDALEGYDLNHTNINWSGGTIIDSGGGVSVLDENQDLLVPTSSRLIFNEASNLNQSLRSYNNLTVNGILTHGYNTHATTGTESLIKLNWTINGDLTVNSGGSINVDAKGYPVGNGPGTPPTNSGTTGSGASYGGVGALGAGLPETPGSTYGSSTAPTDLGSGGGYTCSGGTPNDRVGLWGGGAIILNITGTTTINGSISSNGSTEEVIDLCWNPGSGSGGSVYLRTDGLVGTGSITANGAGSAAKRGGGGGRIAIYANNAVSNPSRTAGGGITGNVLNNGTDGTVLPTIYPSVTTDSISDNYTGTSATANSTITNIGYYSINNHGVVWATWNNPNFPNVNLIDNIVSGTPYGSKNSALVPNAFDSSTSTKWFSNAGAPYDLEYGFPYNVVVNRYVIVGSEIITESPRDWQFQAWDGVDWINLQTITSQTGWAIRESRTYNLVNETPYEKYRILISANNGSTYTALTDIEFKSTNENFSQSGFINEIGPYSESMSGLSPNTTYYVRAFLSTNDGIIYGDNVSFATGEENSAPSSPSSLGPNIYVTNSWASSSAPTLNFTLSDPDLLEQVKYRIQIDNDSNYSSPVVDYTSGLLNQGANNFIVGQPESTGLYTIGNEGQTLSESTSYYWRVQTIDEVGATSSFTLANSGSIAFKLDLTEPIPGTVNFTSINPTSISMNTAGSSDSLSGIGLYRYYNLTTGQIATSTGLTWSNTGLTPNTLYNYKIDVLDNAFNSSTTPESSRYTRANIPTNINTEVLSQSEILVSWDANSNPIGTEYYVENLTSEFNSGWITSTSTTISGLSCGVSYSFHVKARNAENIETSYSGAVSPDASPCNQAPNNPYNLGFSEYQSGGWVNNNKPTLRFILDDPDASDLLVYRLQVSTDSLFTDLVVDYTSASGSQGIRTFTVGQTEGSGNYIMGSAGQSLVDSGDGYYWRVKSIDPSLEESAWVSANSGNIAFKLDTIAPIPGTLSVLSTTTSSVTLTFSGGDDLDSGLATNPYNFQNTTNYSNSGNINNTTWTNYGLSEGTYNFKIRVFDKANNYTDITLAESVYVSGDGSESGSGPEDPWEGAVTEGFALLINQNESLVSTRNVTLQLTGQTGTTHMRISNFSDFSGSVLEPYNTTKNWDICDGIDPCVNGTYNVYAIFYNNASSSGIVSDSIYYQVLDSLNPGNLSIDEVGTSTITVSISGSSDSQYGLAVSPYNFQNITNSTNSGNTNSATWTSSNLTPNTKYDFYTTVTNTNGDSGITPFVSTYTEANVPTGLTLETVTQNSVSLFWNANNNPSLTDYEIYDSLSNQSFGWFGTTSANILNLACDTDYELSARARNGLGVLTLYSSSVAFKTNTCPIETNNESGISGSSQSGSGAYRNQDHEFCVANPNNPSCALYNIDLVAQTDPVWNHSNALQNKELESWTVEDHCEVSTNSFGWFGKYYDYPKNHPNVQVAPKLWDSVWKNIFGDPLSSKSAWQGDWYDDKYFRFAKTSPNLKFGSAFFPFNYIPEKLISGKAYYFGAVWKSKVEVLKPGLYSFRITSDDDSWFYIDGKLITDNSGIHAPRSMYGTVYLSSEHLFEIYFAERHTTESHFYFVMTPEDQLIFRPYNLGCTIVEEETSGSDTVPVEDDITNITEIASPEDKIDHPDVTDEKPVLKDESPKVVIPPINTEIITDLTDSITQNINNVGGKIVDLIEGVKRIILVVDFENFVSKFASLKQNLMDFYNQKSKLFAVSIFGLAPIILSLQYSLSLFSGLGRIKSIKDFLFGIIGLIQSFIRFFVVRKKVKIYGLVFDTINTKPVAFVMIKIVDASTSKALSYEITNSKGEFSFEKYNKDVCIEVNKKGYTIEQNYNSISHEENEYYYNGSVFNPNQINNNTLIKIPLLNNYYLEEGVLVNKSSTHLKYLRGILEILFWTGFVSTFIFFIFSINILSGTLLVFYIALAVLKKYVPSIFAGCKVVSKGKSAVGLYVEVYPISNEGMLVGKSLTDRFGRFYIKVPEGNYVVKIKKIEGNSIQNIKNKNIYVGENGIIDGTIEIP